MAAIIQNSGTNYTLYYNVLNYFKTIMDNHPSIQMVTQGNIEDFDTREFPMYPVGNISITSAEFDGTVTNYGIQIIIADKIKNKDNESEPRTNAMSIPFYGVDDVVDIHANALAIINDLTAFTQRSTNGFEINDIITNEPFEDRFNNGLAGWASTFTLTVHNDRNRCLFFLINPNNTGYKLRNCLTQETNYAVLRDALPTGSFFKTSIGSEIKWFEVISEENSIENYNYVNLSTGSTVLDECLICEPNKFIVLAASSGSFDYYYIPTGSNDILTGSATTARQSFEGKLVGFVGNNYRYVLGPDSPVIYPTASCDCNSVQVASQVTQAGGLVLFWDCTMANGLRSSSFNGRTFTVCTQDANNVWFNREQQNNGGVILVGPSSDSPCQPTYGQSCAFPAAPTASLNCTTLSVTASADYEFLRYYPCSSSLYTELTLSPYTSQSLCISYTGSAAWSGDSSMFNLHSSC